jgi:signal transduction histidine kinase
VEALTGSFARAAAWFTARIRRREVNPAPAAGPPSAAKPAVGSSARIVAPPEASELTEAEAYREAFLAILSHELGTPITSIYAASTLLSRPGLDEARRAELVGDIAQEAERLRRLVEDLIVLARAERGTIQVHTEPVLLPHVLRNVCEQQMRRWPDNTFELTVAPPVPVARAEESFVEQIVRNMLENAAKYGPPDSPVEVVVDAPDGCPRVRVLDRGPGIDPDEAERLFEVFYRSPRTSRVAGSGMGCSWPIAWWSRSAAGSGRGLETTGPAPNSGSSCSPSATTRRRVKRGRGPRPKDGAAPCGARRLLEGL